MGDPPDHGCGVCFKFQFVGLLDFGKSLGPLVLRGLSGEQPDWGSYAVK
jgi:hypothetical protein